MTMQWKRRWRWVCIGGVLVTLVITFQALARFNFSHASWIGSLKRQWRGDRAHLERNVRPQIIAHRGAGVIDAETRMRIGNTLQGIEDAIGRADWIEIDLRQSSDGTLWVFHDKQPNRVTHYGGSRSFDELHDRELRQLRIKGSSEETIPTLEEVLEKFSSPTIRFILDIKFSSKPGAEEQDATSLLELVDEYLRRDQVILFGGYDELRRYKGRGVRLGYTAMWSEGSNKVRFLLGHQFLLDRCRELDCDYLILPSGFLNQSLIDESQANGLEVWAYGISDPIDWMDSVGRGVTGLIVDDLDQAGKTFSVLPAK